MKEAVKQAGWTAPFCAKHLDFCNFDNDNLKFTFFLADSIFKEHNVAWNKDSAFLELSLSRQPSIQIFYADFFKQ